VLFTDTQTWVLVGAGKSGAGNSSKGGNGAQLMAFATGERTSSAQAAASRSAHRAGTILPVRIHGTSAALAVFVALPLSCTTQSVRERPAVSVPATNPAQPTPERRVLSVEVLDESGAVLGEAPELAKRLSKCEPPTRGWALLRFVPPKLTVQDSATLDATQLSCFQRGIREFGGTDVLLYSSQVCLIYIRVS
jgi:hypothetical protein